MELGQAAQAIRAAFEALQTYFGPPNEDGFGDGIFELLAQRPGLDAKFEEWGEAYAEAGDWGIAFETLLKKYGIEPKQFWGGE
ncbi:hypothetical protein GCM10017783_25910 [Deinococcus piscis]|uniref:Uncharacterized protein n=1 Tax=Deinococcus piscis TaxID=394230 RepID=A0ABQ3KBL2_9DEIO|nr:hypothetical protein GCM10017783_25910 [Deinococcus piscis]